MNRVRLHFWNLMRYIFTFLCLAYASLAALDLAGRMPVALDSSLKSLLLPHFPGFLPPHLHRIWIPLAVTAAVFFLIARLMKRHRRFWTPSGFSVLPVSNGGYLRRVDSSQFKDESKTATSDLKRMAKEAFRSGDLHFGVKRYKEASEKFQESTFAVATKSAYLNLGVSLFCVASMERATNAFEIGLSLAHDQNSEKFLAAFLCNSGIVKRERGELTEALSCFERAYSTCRKIGDSLGRACALGNIGSVHLLRGEDDAAMESWELANKDFRRIGLTAGLAAALDGIGSVYGAKGEYRRALKHHRKARTLYKTIHSLHGEAQTLANIGHARFKLGRWRRSLRAGRAAIKIAEPLGSYVEQAKAHGAIGLVYQKRNKLAEALDSFQKSLELYKKIGNPVGIGEQLANIGSIYALEGRKKEALLKLGEARSKFLQTGARTDGYHTIEAAKDLSLLDSTFDKPDNGQPGTTEPIAAESPNMA